jgi:hypothetical protein
MTMTIRKTVAAAALLSTFVGTAAASTLVYDQPFAGFGGEQFDINSPDVPAALTLGQVEVSASQSGGVSTISVLTSADITAAGYQTIIIDVDGNGSADLEVGYENGTIFTQTRNGPGAFNAAIYPDNLGWTGKNVGSFVAGSITFADAGFNGSGFSLTTSDLGPDARVAGFVIYGDQGVQGVFLIDGSPVDFSGQGEAVIFADGDYFGDPLVSINAPFISIPAPSAAGLLSIAALAGTRRRR